jgi:hypothetical protein
MVTLYLTVELNSDVSDNDSYQESSNYMAVNEALVEASENVNEAPVVEDSEDETSPSGIFIAKLRR